MAYTHLLFWILVVPLMGLDGTQGPCPTPCRCTLEILNCSRITDSPGFHLIPLPQPGVHPHPFTYLDFTGNVILSVGKEVWDSYPWAEYLILRANSLSRVQTSSLEGLHSLTYLDLSHNKIHIIERNAFEAVPFLEIINLSGNMIDQIAEGTFEAWHGMQFLLTVDLSHNPLTAIQDSRFYSLPSLNFVDLGATKVTPKTLENLLQSSLHLETLRLPRKMSCCLCSVKENTDVSLETITLECAESCAIDGPLCEKKELSDGMQEVTKTLEARKLNRSNLLHILPERAEPHNYLLESAEPNRDMLAPAQNDSNIGLKLNLLKSVKEVMQMKGDEPLDMNWADQKQLKTLYLLASVLEGALRAKIMEQLQGATPEAALQSAIPAQGLEESPQKASNQERLVREMMRQNWLRITQRSKATLSSPGKDGQEFAKAPTQPADQPSISGYSRKQMVLALSLTALLMAIVFLICLFKICSECSASKSGFLARFHKYSTDEEHSVSTEKTILNKDQPPLKTDKIQYEDETRKTIASGRPVEEPSSVPTLEILVPPLPPPPNSPAPSTNK
ncbi:uncharacterized protein LOC143841495 [Paroedura picta]|uniref:uncharacterized protein LOC143841495 n=1 Tax=Paroedura picta TaxID=143630 RepID=UPI004057B046